MDLWGVCSITDDHPIGLITLCDITSRKQVEQVVAREHNLLKTIMNDADSATLLYLDCDFNFICVNEGYAKACGYRPEEMIGENYFDLFPNPENKAIFTRVRDTGEDYEARDKPFIFPDQPERGVTYWDWTLKAVKNIEGQVIGLGFSLYETHECNKNQDTNDQPVSELKNISQKVGTLTGLLTICSCCKNIQDDSGDWIQIESYIRDRTEVQFTHGICPVCAKVVYPNIFGSN